MNRDELHYRIGWAWDSFVSLLALVMGWLLSALIVLAVVGAVLFGLIYLDTQQKIKATNECVVLFPERTFNQCLWIVYHGR